MLLQRGAVENSLAGCTPSVWYGPNHGILSATKVKQDSGQACVLPSISTEESSLL